MTTCYYCGDVATHDDACEHHTRDKFPLPEQITTYKPPEAKGLSQTEILHAILGAVAYARQPENKGREVESAWNWLRGYLLVDWRAVPAAHEIAQTPINEGGHIE